LTTLLPSKTIVIRGPLLHIFLHRPSVQVGPAGNFFIGAMALVELGAVTGKELLCGYGAGGFVVTFCGCTSLTATLFASPLVYTQGLCGLSGIGHGLMAFSGLEMMRDGSNRNTGVVIGMLVVVKSIYEAAAGTVLFAFFHRGMCGVPLAACHAGGVLGGIVSFFLFSGGAIVIKAPATKTAYRLARNNEYTIH